MPLVFLPDRALFLLWGDDTRAPELRKLTEPARSIRADIVTPQGRRVVDGVTLPVLEATTTLAALPAAALASLPGSLATWGWASKLAIELVSQERVVPALERTASHSEARWVAALSASDAIARVAALARSMPPAAHAVPVSAGVEVWAPDALLRAYLDAAVDALVRSAEPESSAQPQPDGAHWQRRWRAALTGHDKLFETHGFAERSVLEDLERWSAPAIGAADRLRACFRLELPSADDARFRLSFLLQSPHDPSLLVLASEVWKTRGQRLEKLGRAFRDPQESLLEALGRAARVYAPIEPALQSAKPESVELDPESAWAFLESGAAALAEAGFGVLVPGELTRRGQRRLRLQMRVGKKSKVAGAVAGAAGLGLDALVDVDWQVMLGDHALSARELDALAKHKQPLVRHRGAWVAIDPSELAEIQRRMALGPRRVPLREVVQAALVGETHAGPLAIGVAASGSVADLLERMRRAPAAELAGPSALRATLRPYQARGVAWLSQLSSLGFGACLADDMGLGKTVQVIAFLLRRRERSPHDARPILVVAPTSVIGNWQREVERFAPTLEVTQHYGGDRSRAPKEFPRGPGSLVVTTYGLLRRDHELFAAVDWGAVVLDEAQNIKNSASLAARAARSLRAAERFALTGTPVENRLAELWSILEFTNPGLLGPLERFRRELAVPIERYGDDAAAERLQRIVSPFVLRRSKTDPSVISDLPEKNEMKVVCTLTPEQATLYKAVVEEELRRIRGAEGMERRGRVLALLVALKQICNHPAQYLAERGPLAKRSGKLMRVTEMLEEALAAGDKALVFTQFREMAERLVAHFEASLPGQVVSLHGGTPKRARERIVEQFQDEPRGPRILVASLKAGGTGLNLTAASHVFHYDRWWNPAVEDQATDRAHRIGQTRRVQVYKFVAAGTVEEKVDELILHKQKLAALVVRTGEQWIGELSDSELYDLFSLSKDAVVAGDDEEDAAAVRRSRRARPHPELQP
jgi:superfamily II DNA or RNA helicase